ncbi:MAG TPA: UvrB/UvrC motif-containing protein [Longimicrobiales bacterium]|nr:UvrB/UvrC motif-containing protein [Longimicrobiales bacterium]
MTLSTARLLKKQLRKDKEAVSILASSNGHVAVELRARVRALAENRPAVYRMLGPNDEVIYVGKSISLRNRLLSYFRADAGEKATDIISYTRRITWDYVSSEFAALLLEMKLIQRWRPLFNVQHKSETNFCFIKLTREEAPRLLVTVQVLNDGAHYYGPFRGRGMVRDVLREVSDVLELRDCAPTVKLRFADQMDLFTPDDTPRCIRADVHKCLAPCAGRCTRTEYQGRVAEARKFLEGDVRKPLNVLNQRMQAAAERMHFEYAAQLRDRATRLEEARYELVAARASIEALTFLYRVPGYRGDDRIYAIRRGSIRGEWPAPASETELQALKDTARPLLTRRERHTTTVTAEQVNEVLLIARWFRLKPDQLNNVLDD